MNMLVSRYVNLSKWPNALCKLSKLTYFGKSGFFARDEACAVDYGPVQLLIIDPLCPTNNVAASTFALYKVKQAFANGYNTLTERFASPFCPSLLSRLLPIVMTNGFTAQRELFQMQM